MNIQNLLSQFASSQTQTHEPNSPDQSSNLLAAIASSLPGGLAGGAAAGGVLALLLGSKSARKVAGNVATIGGTALLGGLAYKAYDNWKQNKPLAQTESVTTEDIERAQSVIPESVGPEIPLNLVLVKSMIAAAKADGHLDSVEQKNIFEAVEKLGLSSDQKAAIFDAMSRDISVQELAQSVTEEHHKAEVYISVLLAIDVDHQDERTYLDSLAVALELPEGLPAYLEEQARIGIS